ncbi:MAG TPA: hypothetical protein VEM59_05540, partial [Acidimicrobiia bacterium]|nr:hypothetical protein [Acidimicrobiia bacterium]
HHFFPNLGLPPHRPRRLLLFEAEEVDHLVQIGDQFDAKVQALLCHHSQWRSTMGIDPEAPVEAQREAFVARVRFEAETAGRAAGIGPAEGFKLIDKV